MPSPDVSRLSSTDCLAALRSYPRRYRGAALPLPDDPIAEEWADRIGPDAVSAVDIVSRAAATMVFLQQALHQVLVQTDPVLHGGVLDATERDWPTPPGQDIHAALGRFDEAAGALADDVSRVPATDWMRTGTLAGGGTVSAIDIVREAVRAGADDLHRIETTIAAVR